MLTHLYKDKCRTFFVINKQWDFQWFHCTVDLQYSKESIAQRNYCEINPPVAKSVSIFQWYLISHFCFTYTSPRFKMAHSTIDALFTRSFFPNLGVRWCYSHTHCNSQTETHKNTQTIIITYPPNLIYTDIYSHAHNHIYTPVHTHIDTQSNSHIHTHTSASTPIYTYPHIYAYGQIHSCTQTSRIIDPYI